MTASPALASALARIEREFGIDAAHAAFKQRCRKWMRAGAADFQTYCHFRELAFDFEEMDLDTAIAELNVRASNERVQRRYEARMRGQSPQWTLPLHGQVGEARVILRWLRRYHDSAHLYFALIISAFLLPFGAQREAVE